jgi:hypothetical protein
MLRLVHREREFVGQPAWKAFMPVAKIVLSQFCLNARKVADGPVVRMKREDGGEIGEFDRTVHAPRLPRL